MTDAPHHHILRTAYHQVIGAPKADRDRIIADVCAAAPEIRDELHSLLKHADDGDRLDRAATEWRQTAEFAASNNEGSAPLPPTFGRYRIIRRLGSGSMGDVYLAEQRHPRRTVALKTLHHAFVSGRQRRRFELESEILGRLDHPGIARILEAGCDADRPYFVMEFVDGVSLTAFAASHDCDLRTRIGLLLDVCDAVAHAHQRGVVHRDLKPGNILVAPNARIRVLDFGVARASSVSEVATLETHAGELMGTLPYMSPEQLDGDPDVDIRADVYALGVLAYELLSGVRPVDLDAIPLPVAIRRARSAEPRPLSRHDPALRGDLELIVDKAMRKHRAERYANVIELAADFRRWLNHEPITARPPGYVYQLRKFAERNRTLVATGGMVVFMLIVAIIAVSVALVDANQQRSVAEEATRESDRQRDAARAANDTTRRQRDAYLSILAFADIDRDRAEALAATLDFDTELDSILAHAYAARGDFNTALTHALRALSVLERHEHDNEESIHELLWLSLKVDTTHGYSDRTNRWRTLNSSLLTRTAPELGAALQALDDARPDLWSRDVDERLVGMLLDEVIRATDEFTDDDLNVQLVADRLEWMALIYSGRQAHDVALELVERAQSLRRRHLMETSPRMLWGRITLLDILLRSQRFNEAEATATRTLATLEPLLPDHHVHLAMMRRRLGEALVLLDRPAAGAELLRSAEADLRRSVAPESRELAESLRALTNAADALGLDDEHDRWSQAFLDCVARGPFREHWPKIRGRMPSRYAELESAAGRALRRLSDRDAIDRFDHFFRTWDHIGPDAATSVALSNVIRGWVDVWNDAGGWATTARPILARAARELDEHNGHALLKAEVHALSIALDARLGDMERARDHFERGMALVDAADGSLEWARQYLLLHYGRALANDGETHDAIPLLERAREMLVHRYGPGGYNTQFANEALHLARHMSGDDDAAMRADAGALVAALSTDLPRVHSMSAWQVARLPGHDASTYRQALDAATRATERLPGTWLVQRSLLACQFRNNLHHEALDTLEAVRRDCRSPRPELEAFGVMALAALDDPAVEAAMQRLEALADHPDFRNDVVSQELIAEARAALEQ